MTGPAAEATAPGPITRVMHIINQKGLHARASAKFVQTVEKFDAEVRVSRGAETVGGTSIMGLMMLAASPGTSLTVEASGRDAAAVIAALEDLLGRRFGEDE
jgi:phosphocarrier protein HPr